MVDGQGTSVPEPLNDLDVVLGSRHSYQSTGHRCCRYSDVSSASILARSKFGECLDGAAEFTSADVDALTVLVGVVRDGVLDEAQAKGLWIRCNCAHPAVETHDLTAGD